MRKTIKKAAALAMSTISAAGTLAGCDSKSANGTAPDSESPKISEITDRKAVDLDKPYEEVKLTRQTKLDVNVSVTYPDLGDMPWTEYVQEKIGIELEFIHSTVGSETEEFSILIASSEYPDIIEYTWTIYSGSPRATISGDVIPSSTDVMAENMPNFIKLMQEHPGMDKMVRSANGDYYCFPFPRGLESLNPMQFSTGMVLRKGVLDEFGLEMPETIDK